MRLDIEVRNAQRELDALKRGMFGGARQFFDTTTTSKTFSNVSDGQKILTLTYPIADFPMVTIDVTSGGVPYSRYNWYRLDRYRWIVYVQVLAGTPAVNVDVTIMSEQVPTAVTLA